VKTFRKYLRNPYNNFFTVAFGNDGYKQPAWAAAYSISLCRNVLNWLADTDALGDPYTVLPAADPGGNFNFNIPLGDKTFRVSANLKGSKKQLLAALKSSGNFLWSGHGNVNVISTMQSGGVKIKANEVAKYLGNPVKRNEGTLGGQRVNVEYRTTYKLVILAACYAYSLEWANAFGIADFTKPRKPENMPITPPLPPTLEEYLSSGRSTDTVEDYGRRNKIPQAFVGWPVYFWTSCAAVFDNKGTQADIQIDEIAYDALFSRWQDGGDTISECINKFGQMSSAIQMPPGDALARDHILDNLKWELSGCFDLTTFDRNP
jgi:hypothetical protein